MNITNLINQVRDPSVRRALQAIFDQLKADLDANKAAFDAHTHHTGTAFTSAPASDAAGNANGTRETFVQNLG